MKLRQILIAVMLCMSFCVFSSLSNNATAQNQLQQPTLEQLQKENEKLQQQLENQDKKIEWYRDDLRHTEDQMNDNLSHWLVILTLVMTIIGIVIPIMIDSRKNTLRNNNNNQQPTP